MLALSACSSSAPPRRVRPPFFPFGLPDGGRGFAEIVLVLDVMPGWAVLRRFSRSRVRIAGWQRARRADGSRLNFRLGELHFARDLECLDVEALRTERNDRLVELRHVGAHRVRLDRGERLPSLGDTYHARIGDVDR